MGGARMVLPKPRPPFLRRSSATSLWQDAPNKPPKSQVVPQCLPKERTQRADASPQDGTHQQDSRMSLCADAKFLHGGVVAENGVAGANKRGEKYRSGCPHTQTTPCHTLERKRAGLACTGP